MPYYVAYKYLSLIIVQMCNAFLIHLVTLGELCPQLVIFHARQKNCVPKVGMFYYVKLIPYKMMHESGAVGKSFGQKC